MRRAIADAKAATDDFAAWVAAEAPKKTGPVGLGKENYNWYVKNVELLPYDWDAQVALLATRTRSLTGVAAAGGSPQPRPAPHHPAHRSRRLQALVKARQAKFSQFLADTGLIPDAPWSRAAIANQAIDYCRPVIATSSTTSPPTTRGR